VVVIVSNIIGLVQDIAVVILFSKFTGIVPNIAVTVFDISKLMIISV
jgi:hypothetical protein